MKIYNVVLSMKFSRKILLLGLLAFAVGCGEERDARRTPVVAAVEKCLPSVVNIGTERIVKTVYQDPQQRSRGSIRDRFFSDFLGLPPPPSYKLAHSLGSGVVIHPAGYILTNYHVVEKASRIFINLGEGGNQRARLVARDPVSDLSLLKVDVDEPLEAIDLARDDDLLLGEKVVVLGNPYGLSRSVSVGVLSSKSREARYNGKVLFKDILQTDAAVNPGSSGGPLLNVDGEMIGINIAVYREAQNIGFAVPVKRVRELLRHWLTPEFLMKRWLGFTVKDHKGSSGVKVGRIESDSPAARSGLEVGDVIVSVGGNKIGSVLEYNQELVSSARRKEAVSLGVKGWLGSRRLDLAWQEIPTPSGLQLARDRLGLEVATESDDSEDGYGKGVRIKRVLPDSPASEAGLYPELYIVAVDGQTIQSLDSLADTLGKVESGEKVLLTLVKVSEQGTFRLARQVSIEVTAQ